MSKYNSWGTGELIKELEKRDGEIKITKAVLETELARVSAVLQEFVRLNDWTNDLPSPTALIDDIEKLIKPKTA